MKSFIYIYILNISFGQLLNNSPKKIIFLKTFNSEFLYIEVWFNDQKSKPIEIEDLGKIWVKLLVKIEAQT